MRITADMLIAAGACDDEVSQFRDLFGEGVRLTRAALLRAAKGGMGISFLADSDMHDVIDGLYLEDDPWQALHKVSTEYTRNGFPSQAIILRRQANLLADHWGLK